MTEYKRVAIFLPTGAIVNIDCSSVQLAANVLVVWKDDICVAQAAAWMAWAWVDGEGKIGDKHKAPELSIVTSIDSARKPAETPADSTLTPPEAA